MRLSVPRHLVRIGMLVLGLFLALIVGRLWLTTSAAQGPSDECIGLDVVFLIDQSGSMKTNDPQKIRSNAVDTAIDILGDNAVYFCPGVQHRIAVLGFGDKPNNAPDVVEYVSPRVLSPTLETLTAWQDERDDVIKASIPLTDDLVATDPLSALKSTEAILDQWRDEPLGDDVRKRAVIMMTDGPPCIIDDGCVPGNEDNYVLKPYLDKLKAYTDPLEDALPWKGEDNPDSVQIWLIGFSTWGKEYDPFHPENSVRKAWDSVTTKHGGEVRVLEQKGDRTTLNTDLTSVVANILDGSLLGSNLEGWDCRKPIWVEPYQSSVTIIHVFRRGANPGVALDEVVVRIKAVRGGKTIAEYQGGRVVTGRGKVNDYTPDGPNERYVFHKPEPGKYLVEVEGADLCEHLEVRIGQGGLVATLLEPSEGTVFPEVDEEPYYDEVTPHLFRFQFFQPSHDEGLEPLQENSDFPLDVQVTVREGPDIQEEVEDVYHLESVDREQGIWEARKEGAADYIRTPYDGHYTWELVGTTNNPRAEDTESSDTTPIQVLTMTGTFSADPVQRFSFHILTPEQQDVLLSSDIENGKRIPVPVDVVVQLVDEGGNALNPERVVADTGSPVFEIRILNETGVLVETQSLKYEGKPTFTAIMRDLAPTENVDAPGSYRIEVELQSNYDRMAFRPYEKIQQVQFRRDEAQEFDFHMLTEPDQQVPLLKGEPMQSLVVDVQVLDKEGNPMGDTLPIADRTASPYRASLMDADGQVLDAQPMAAKEGTGNVYTVEFCSDRSGPSTYEPGTYTVVVDLTDDYRSRVFRPKRKSLPPLHVGMVLVREFDWQIAAPPTGTHTIHPTLDWFPEPKSVPLEIDVAPTEGTAIRAKDIVNADAGSLFVGRLYRPGRSEYKEIEYRPVDGEARFAAEWPDDAADTGDYRLEVHLVSEAISDLWLTQRDTPLERPFHREDTLLTLPWALLAALILGVLLVATVVLSVLTTGRLLGTWLTFSRERRGSAVGEVKLYGPLSRRRHCVRSRILALAVPSLKLARIFARVAVATEPDARVAVDIELVWRGEEGDPEDRLSLDGVNEGEDIDIGGGLRMKLEKRHANWLAETWWFIFFVLLSFGAWFSVFGYLYLRG